VSYYDQAQQALAQAPPDHKITWNHIKQHTQDVLSKLSQMKFREPNAGEQANVKYYHDLMEEIHASFRSLNENAI